MGEPLKGLKARKPLRRRGTRYVLIELHRWNKILTHIEGLIATGSADARSLAADFALPTKAKAR